MLLDYMLSEVPFLLKPVAIGGVCVAVKLGQAGKGSYRPHIGCAARSVTAAAREKRAPERRRDPGTGGPAGRVTALTRPCSTCHSSGIDTNSTTLGRAKAEKITLWTFQRQNSRVTGNSN